MLALLHPLEENSLQVQEAGYLNDIFLPLLLRVGTKIFRNSPPRKNRFAPPEQLLDEVLGGGNLFLTCTSDRSTAGACFLGQQVEQNVRGAGVEFSDESGEPVLGQRKGGVGVVSVFARLGDLLRCGQLGLEC